MRHDVTSGVPVLADVRVVSEWPLAQHDGMFFTLVCEEYGDDWDRADRAMRHKVALAPWLAWARPWFARR